MTTPLLLALAAAAPLVAVAVWLLALPSLVVTTAEPAGGYSSGVGADSGPVDTEMLDADRLAA